MTNPKTKLAAFAAGLCLLCCAAPLTALFVGGGVLTSMGFLVNETKLLVIAIGVAAMAIALYAILRRHRRNCNSCDVR